VHDVLVVRHPTVAHLEHVRNCKTIRKHSRRVNTFFYLGSSRWNRNEGSKGTG
jgi:hypothetical protein